MSKKLNFAVLGSGNGGRAFCGQIAGKGYPVVMYEPLNESEEFLKLRKEKEMFLKGDITTGGKLHDVTMDMEEAIGEADVIFIVVPSFAHQPIFQKMIPHLKSGQHIVVVPGNYGGFLLKKMMVDLNIKAGISISETASLPYACRTTKYNTVMIHKKKFRLKIATSPRKMNNTVINIINDVFSGFVDYFSGKNLLEIDLENFNQILHPLPVLLNYGAIEQHPETFRHYLDGVTPLISKIMLKMDDERMAIGRAFGLQLISTMDQLKLYYGDNDAETIFDYVNSAESPYKDIVGQSVTGRYITEDVPGLNVPAIELAKLVGVKVPVTKLCVKLSSTLHEIDYATEGTTLEKLGISGKIPEEIILLGA
ncbi:MAG: NAD/NADP octopine/nopaline dehydrogenase [Promethearchaeota archaeon]|nr:MAG: NAD/NADP octopine/nopaline dehydrogenase [Candidatus Lokiarchaeota archaeon]